MRISDWSSDVCSSDLASSSSKGWTPASINRFTDAIFRSFFMRSVSRLSLRVSSADSMASLYHRVKYLTSPPFSTYCTKRFGRARSEEHTSELQSLMRISYAVFCLNKNTNNETEETT